MSAKPTLRPIVDDDFSSVAAFLHAHLNLRIAPHEWLGVLSPPWPTDNPHRGYLLTAEEGIIGASVVMCVRRTWKGQSRTVGNLAALSVLPGHEVDTIRLLRKQLRHPGIEFTDLAPTKRLAPINERLGFSYLDTHASLSPNLPCPPRPAITVTSDPAMVTNTLDCSDDSRIYQDHMATSATRHIVIKAKNSHAYLVVRRQEWPRWRTRPLIALPLYAGGDADLLRRSWPQVASHLLTEHGLLATIAERRILGFTPRNGIRKSPRTRMAYLRRITPESVDYLYSDLSLFETI